MPAVQAPVIVDLGRINGVSITGTPTAGQVAVANAAGQATWTTLPTAAASAGRYIGAAPTFAALPATNLATGAAIDGDWVDLTANDIGTGTALAPQYPAGTYVRTAGVYVLSAADSAAPGLAKSATAPLMSGVASAGTETAYAAGDHVHPTDTTLVPKTDIVDNLTAGGATKVLSAEQGKTLTAADVASGAVAGNNLTLTLNGGGTVVVDVTALAANIRVVSGSYNAVTQEIDFVCDPVTGNFSVPVAALLPVTVTAGDITGNGSTTALALANTAVVAGPYTNANVTFDSKGRAIAATSGAPAAGRYIGAAATFAALPTTSTATGPAVDGDWVDLTVADIGTGTALAPQYPSGIYVRTAGVYALSAADPVATVVSKSLTVPAMDGVAAAGVETAYAAGDHVHPTDTTLIPKTDIVDNLTAGGTAKVLSAEQGKALTASDLASGVVAGNSLTLTLKGGGTVVVDITTLAADIRVVSGSYNSVTQAIDFVCDPVASNFSVPVAALLPVTTTPGELTGNGSTVALGLADTAVTAGAYKNPNVTFDAKGRAIAAADGVLSAGRFLGTSATFATLPVTNASTGPAVAGDWAILSADDGANQSGVYVYSGAVFALSAQLADLTVPVTGRFVGSAATFAALPTTSAATGAALNGDWAVLNTLDGTNKRGIYVYNGATYAFAIELANLNAIAGRDIGAAATYATLPTTSGATGPAVDGDTAFLTADTIGSGTALAPQYPRGIYRMSAGVYGFVAAVAANGGGNYAGAATTFAGLSALTARATDWAILSLKDGANERGVYTYSGTAWVFSAQLADLTTAIAGQFVGSAATFATLPVTSAATGAVSNGDWAILNVDEVGTGTVAVPQYPRGIYVHNGSLYSLAVELADLNAPVAGRYIGAAATFATLPVTSGATGAAINGDTVFLSADTVGTGSVAAPQYPRGLYVRTAGVYALSVAIPLAVGIAGRFIGPAATYATLPATSAPTGAAVDGDTAFLTADTVGTGSVLVPQYPRGLYTRTAGVYALSVAIPLSAAAADTVQTLTGTGAVTAWNSIVLVNSASDATATLPTVTAADIGKQITIKSIGAGVVTVATADALNGTLPIKATESLVYEATAIGTVVALPPVITPTAVQTLTGTGAATAWNSVVTVASAAVATVTLPTITAADIGKFIVVKSTGLGQVTVTSADAINGTYAIRNTGAITYRATALGTVIAISDLNAADRSIPNSPASITAPGVIANLPTGGAIGTAAATVDVLSAFILSQTTSGQIVTLPTPTLTTAARLVYLSSRLVSSQVPFTFYGQSIAPGQTGVAVWDGANWAGIANGTTNIAAETGATTATFTVNNATATFVDITNSGFTLPTPGVWEVTYFVQYNMATSGGLAYAQIATGATGTAGPIAESLGVTSNENAAGFLIPAASRTIFITTTVANVQYHLICGGNNANAKTIATTGSSYVIWRKVASATPVNTYLSYYGQITLPLASGYVQTVGTTQAAATFSTTVAPVAQRLGWASLAATGSIAYATGTFTVPVAGFYRVTLVEEGQTSVAGAYGIQVVKNLTTVVAAAVGTANTANTTATLTASVVLQLVANDTLDARVVNVNGGTVTHQGGTFLVESLGGKPATQTTLARAICNASAATAAGAGGSGVVVTWNTELLDNGNNMNPATGLFTCPRTGVYRFDAAVFVGTTTSTVGSRLGLIIGPSAQSFGSGHPIASHSIISANQANFQIRTTVIRSCTAGEAVGVKFFLDQVTAATLSGNANFDFFHVEELPSIAY